MVKYASYREYLNDTHFHYLYYSAMTFIFPSLYSLYIHHFDHFLLQFTTFLTSILRWKYPKNTYFELIDHNYVKLVFLTNIFYIYYSINEQNQLYIYFMILLLLSAIIFYILGCIAFHCENNINIPLHMIVHLYTTCGFFVATTIYKSYWIY